MGEGGERERVEPRGIIVPTYSFFFFFFFFLFRIQLQETPRTRVSAFRPIRPMERTSGFSKEAGATRAFESLSLSLSLEERLEAVALSKNDADPSR